jgi:hypothetical protein
MNREERQSLAEAGLLADFANLDLKDAAAVERFRHSVGDDFVPAPLFWTRKHPQFGRDSCETVQPILREAWIQRFSPELAVSLIAMLQEISITSATHRWVETFKHADSELTSGRINSEGVASMLNHQEELQRPKCFVFQTAVMYLTLRPHLAKICEMRGCGKFFVGASQRDRYCSSRCAREAVLLTKRSSALAHNHWRSKKSKSR